MKTALIQMMVQTGNDANLDTACSYVHQAAVNGAEMVMLPELFSCPYDLSLFRGCAQPEGGANWQRLSACARAEQVYLIAGSMPEIDSEGNLYNTSYVFAPDGGQIAKHRKMHLYDVSLKGKSFLESSVFQPGEEITTFETPYGTMGLMICFDIRFPELSRVMALRGAKVIFVPAVFNTVTGPVHWELLFRARAVDNQVFMVGCAPARDPNMRFRSYGNSLAVTPWGDVAARLDEREGMLLFDLDLNEVASVRAQLPLLQARRDDIYHIAVI